MDVLKKFAAWEQPPGCPLAARWGIYSSRRLGIDATDLDRVSQPPLSCASIVLQLCLGQHASVKLCDMPPRSMGISCTELSIPESRRVVPGQVVFVWCRVRSSVTRSGRLVLGQVVWCRCWIVSGHS